ncbi:LYR motif-containing protein 4 isoform X2 [Lathamus discolor]|uniref:LYR motif-containing protein 4 isoform X2 n=1 Tax=Lathamus discolor TaxID=678569 RepID=UPI0032B77B8E
MAASSRAQVLRLYRALLRESQRFSSYNYRTYAIRRIRDAFRENKNIKDSGKIEELVNKAKANLEVIHRQVFSWRALISSIFQGSMRGRGWRKQ